MGVILIFLLLMIFILIYFYTNTFCNTFYINSCNIKLLHEASGNLRIMEDWQCHYLSFLASTRYLNYLSSLIICLVSHLWKFGVSLKRSIGLKTSKILTIKCNIRYFNTTTEVFYKGFAWEAYMKWTKSGYYTVSVSYTHLDVYKRQQSYWTFERYPKFS